MKLSSPNLRAEVEGVSRCCLIQTWLRVEEAVSSSGGVKMWRVLRKFSSWKLRSEVLRLLYVVGFRSRKENFCGS